MSRAPAAVTLDVEPLLLKELNSKVSVRRGDVLGWELACEM